MKVEGSDLIPAEPSLIWPLLMDANALRRMLPGCEVLNGMGSNEYRLTVRQRLGPYEDLFGGTLFLSEKDTDSSLHAVANLESPNGMIRIAGDIQLDSAGEGSTLLRYEGEIEVGGRLMSVSPRLLETTANAYIRRTLEAMERETAVPQPYSLRTPPITSTAETSRSELAIHVPSWAVAILAAATGALALRLLDNRRIDRLGEKGAAGKIPSRIDPS